MFKTAVAVTVLLALAGCGKQPASAVPQASKSTTPADPDQALYDQVRSGAYQIGSAIDSMEDVRKTVREIAASQSGKTQQALLQIAGDLDDAGKSLADFGDDPPPFDQFKKLFAAQDDRRLRAIAAANDSLDDLSDAQDIVGELQDSKPAPPPQIAGQLADAGSDLDDCAQAVTEAIKTMGGKVTEN